MVEIIGAPPVPNNGPDKGELVQGGRTTNQFAPDRAELLSAFFGEDITQTEECIQVWTDGSGRAPKRDKEGDIIESYPSGWAFVAEFKGKEIERSGQIPNSTMNVAEITAIISALEHIKITPNPLIIYTDSSYAKDSLLKWGPEAMRTGEWITSTGKERANKALIIKGVRLLRFHQSFRTAFLRKVKGHSGVRQNERADYLCGEARKGNTIT